MKSLILSLALSQSPLPANHPPVGNLPPNHPAVGDQLPPNHPAVPDQAPQVGKAPSADELLKKLDATADLKSRDKPFEIAVSLGRLYFAQGRYADALGYFQQGLAKAEPVRAFFLAQRKLAGKAVIPSSTEAGCASTEASTMDVLYAAAQEHAKAKRVPQSVACAKSALHGLIEAENNLAQAQFLNGDSVAAVTTFTHAIELFDSNIDAHYGRGATLLDTKGDDLASLKLAQSDFESVVAQAPTSPRAKEAQRFLERTKAAIAAGGLSKLAPAAAPPAMPPKLTPETINAFQNAPRTPEMNANFAKLIDDAEGFLATGKYQDALNSFKQVMPFQPDNARLRAGMAWSLIQLNKQPMATTVWGVATQSPEAVDALGDTLKAKGDTAGAQALWKKLGESVPAYAPKLQGKL